MGLISLRHDLELIVTITDPKLAGQAGTWSVI
jgi:hypothetical protein